MIIGNFKEKYIQLRIRLERGIKNQIFSSRFRHFVKKYLGLDVGIGSYGYLCFPRGTKIGNYCSIADGVKFLAGNHPVEHISTAACFYNPVLGLVKPEYDIERKKLEIGNDVWIGQNVLITNKCTQIPNGVVIGAGSIVTSVPSPYTIVAGNPARIVRKRLMMKRSLYLKKADGGNLKHIFWRNMLI